MNAAHVHLAFNHLPLAGALFAAGLLAAGLWRRNEEWKRAGLGLLVAAGLFAVPTYLSGEGAEERIEGLAGVEEARIEAHEAAALPALLGVEAAAALALAALVLGRGALPRWGAPAALGASLAALALAGRAASLGGEIRHPEIRADAPASLE